MSFASMDSSQVRTLAVGLAHVAATVVPEIRPVIERGALAIKAQHQREMRQSRHFAQVAPAISYTTRVDDGGVEAEIGPRRGKPGSLANIAYFGTSRGGGTVPDPQGALEAEAPIVERHIADAIVRALS